MKGSPGAPDVDSGHFHRMLWGRSEGDLKKWAYGAAVEAVVVHVLDTECPSSVAHPLVQHLRVGNGSTRRTAKGGKYCAGGGKRGVQGQPLGSSGGRDNVPSCGGCLQQLVNRMLQAPEGAEPLTTDDAQIQQLC